MEGSVVEFPLQGGFQVGVVKRVLGKKTLVVAGSNSQFRPLTRDLSEELGVIPADVDVTAFLKALSEEADRLKIGIATEVVWSLSTPGSTYSSSELAQIAFDEPSPASTLAMRRVLRDDSAYFREVEGGWQSRTPELIDEIRKRASAKSRESHERVSIVSKLSAALDSGVLEVDGQMERVLDKVKAVAVHAAHHDQEWVGKLIEELEASRGQYFQSQGRHKAFELLVALGIWNHHENLEVKRFGIYRHGPDLLKIAQEIGQTPIQPGRDLRRVWTFTFDEADTRDMDDALSVELLDDGTWELGVHIADVDEVVLPGTPLDADALRRGTSVYLPDGIVPMLPNVLSEARLSLVQGHDRSAVSLLIRLDAGMEIQSLGFERCLIRVDRRMTYEELDAHLSGAITNEVSDLLQVLGRFTALHSEERRRNGSLSIDLPTPNVRVDWEDGEPRVQLWCTQDTEAHQLVQECMVLYNSLLAELFLDAGIPAVFRKQEVRDGLWEDIQPGPALEFAKLKTMKKGEMSLEAGPHASLGVPAYVQATSPIRRYLDLVHQRQLKAHLAQVSAPYSESTLLHILADASEASFEASRAEQGARRYWTLFSLAGEKEPLDALVLDDSNVLLESCGVISKMTQRSGVEEGERIQVVVDRADPRQDELILRLAH